MSARNLQALAAALGGDVVGASVLVPGPGHSAKDRSLSVTPSIAAPDGLLFFSHAGDDRQECRRHILGRLGRPLHRANLHSASDAARPGPSIEGASRNQAPIGAMSIWKAAVDPRGTIVETYLKGRGLEMGDDLPGRVVRFHPNCPFGPSVRHPCMITAFRSIAGDRLQAIHRTALTQDGKKIDRKMLGPVAGAAIKITADPDVEQGLAIGEGFETGLAALMLGFRPVWALGSAQAIAGFPVLPGIDALTILAETDDRGANARAVKECGARWSEADREVLVATPRVVGDINTALVA